MAWPATTTPARSTTTSFATSRTASARPPAPTGDRATTRPSRAPATSSRRSVATRVTPTTSPSRSRAEPCGSVAFLPRRRVTFSRNLTLSLSRTCVSHCKYCAFATHRLHLHEPDQVERLLDGAARRRVKELLTLTGDAPAHHPGVRERLSALGFDDFVAYVAWCCERALERGLLPHTNLGALSRGDLVRLREVTASQGLAAAHAEHGHLQEVILQNFVPHRRYYGEEPAEIAEEAQRSGTGGEALELPSWATPIGLDDMRVLVREARRLMPDVGIQIPPNLSDWWLPLVDDGATDLGGQ